MIWEEFRKLEKEFERMRKRIEEMARKEFEAIKVKEIPIDIKEEKGELIIEAEIPGIKKENIDINLTENMLSIKAEKKEERKEREEGYLHRERSYYGFHRTITLPVSVIPEKAKASYKDGVLRIVVPKKEKKEKEIKIKIE